MKRIPLVLIMVFVWALALSAQTTQRPSWTKNPPKPKKGNFYYRVTVAEGRDYESAYTKAFAMAIYESYSRLEGIPVSINSSEEDIEKSIAESISTISGQMRLPINKVCEYEESRTSAMGIKLFVLWQVAHSALEDPMFEDFNKCDK
jgi:hypothetical protein